MKIIYPLFILTLLTACINPKSKKEGIKGGYIRLAESEKPTTLIPHFAQNNADFHFLSQIHAGLLRLNPKTLDPEPCIAQKWTLDSIGKTFIIFLRTNAYFHKDSCFGEKLTRKINASDIKYTFELMATKSWNSKHFEGAINEIEGATDFYQKPEKYTHIKGIYLVNDSMLRINLSKPNPFFLHKLAHLSNSILAHEAIEKYGKNNYIGAGPFFIKNNILTNDSLVVYNNDNYFLKDKNAYTLPYIDSACFFFGIPSRDELSFFKNGNIDFVINLSSNYLNEFLEQNIQYFQGSIPLFKISQADDLKEKYLYNLMRSNIQNLNTNSQNLLDLSIIYLKEPEPRGEVKDSIL